MTRRAARIDNNQTEIRAFMEAAGWRTVSTAGVHNGHPDIMVAKHLVNVVVEIKDGKSGKLRESQIEWHQQWAGAVIVIRSLEDAKRLCDNMLPIAGELESLMAQLLDGLEVVEDLEGAV